MDLKESLTVSEKQIDYLINIFFLMIGGYALIESLSFPASAQLWPRNVSFFLVITGTVLLFRTYLPDVLQPLVRDEALFGGDEDETLDVGDEEHPVTDDEERLASDDDAEVEENRNVGRYPIDNSVFTALTMFGYIVLGWAFGLIWATPLYIAFYCWWFQKPWYLTGILAVIGFAVGYAFFDLLYLPIDAGVVTEMVLK